MKKMIKEKYHFLMYDPIFKSLIRSDEAREIMSIILSEITNVPQQELLNASYEAGELPKWKINQKGRSADTLIHLPGNSHMLSK